MLTTALTSTQLIITMSSATVVAIAILENPRVVSATQAKSVTFNVQMWLDEKHRLTGAFRFFNVNEVEFTDVGIYFIHASVSLPHLIH